jgi:hypothetical protein
MRDFTKYDVTIGDYTHVQLPKRRAIFHVIRQLCASGIDPEEIRETVTWKTNMFRVIEGDLDSREFEKKLAEQLVSEGSKPETRRYFIADDELIHANGKTYALTKMWAARTGKAIDLLLERFPHHDISCQESALHA